MVGWPDGFSGGDAAFRFSIKGGELVQDESLLSRGWSSNGATGLSPENSKNTHVMLLLQTWSHRRKAYYRTF